MLSIVAHAAVTASVTAGQVQVSGGFTCSVQQDNVTCRFDRVHNDCVLMDLSYEQVFEV